MPTPSELPLLRAASWGACGTEPIRDGVEQREPLPIRTSTRSIAPPEAVHLAPADPQVVRVSFAGSILVEFGEMSVTEADELRAKFGWHRPGITEHGPATPAGFPTEEAGSGRRPSPRYVGWRVASLRKVFVKANRSPRAARAPASAAAPSAADPVASAYALLFKQEATTPPP
jgi:hypothetical protein